jgi:predicted nucleotidyltransferase
VEHHGAALFGSVLRDDFRRESDVDVLVTFGPDSRWTLFDIVRIQDDLSDLLGRKVDLIERKAVERSENYIRRHHILESLRPIYVAGDDSLLLDMLIHARRARKFAAQSSWDFFQSDDLTQDTILRALGVLRTHSPRPLRGRPLRYFHKT